MTKSFLWFPWFGWSRVTVTREYCEGAGLLVCELWFNWWTARHMTRRALIKDVKNGTLVKDDPWFAARVHESRQSADG